MVIYRAPDRHPLGLPSWGHVFARQLENCLVQNHEIVQLMLRISNAIRFFSLLHRLFVACSLMCSVGYERERPTERERERERDVHTRKHQAQWYVPRSSTLSQCGHTKTFDPPREVWILPHLPQHFDEYLSSVDSSSKTFLNSQSFRSSSANRPCPIESIRAVISAESLRDFLVIREISNFGLMYTSYIWVMKFIVVLRIALCLRAKQDLSTQSRKLSFSRCCSEMVESARSAKIFALGMYVLRTYSLVNRSPMKNTHAFQTS